MTDLNLSQKWFPSLPLHPSKSQLHQFDQLPVVDALSTVVSTAQPRKPNGWF